jgi:Ca-activated chloride channel homolog
LSFLAPAAFAFAATIPVVIVFYLLKRKRTVKLVSSTLLWQKFLAETQASAPFQRLRHNWLLLLQVLLLLLAVLALARPFMAAKVSPSPLRVVILDGSASMQATDESPTRFDKARAGALGLVDAMREGERMMILLVGARTEVRQSPTSDRTALRAALRACTPSDTPTRLADALKTAGAFTVEKLGEKEFTSGEIHLFSDGAVPELGEFENKALPLIFHRVGTGANNLGITALDVRANPDDPTQRALYVSVVNVSSNSWQTELELRFEEDLIETRPLTLGPGETSPQVFLASQPRDGIFSVRLTAKDDLAADNQASIVSLLPKPARILLVSRGNLWLEKALRRAGPVELSLASDLTEPAKGFDFVVLDNVIPTVWPQGNVLAFRVAPTNWFETLTPLKLPPLVDWKTAHPLLRYVGVSELVVRDTLATKTPSWAVPLIEAPQGALAVAGELGRQRILWLGFDTLDSNWPLRVSFPIFIANAVEWLNPAAGRSSQLTVKAGDAFHQPLAAAVTDARITLPDGSTKPLPIEAGATEIVFGDTSKQGTYHLRAGTNDTVFCVDLLDSTESHIQPHDEIKLGTYARVEAATRQRATSELWRWLAGCALAVLLFEWWWYHKRTV